MSLERRRRLRRQGQDRIDHSRGKTGVIYCQSGTRCSHEELILKDLGYENFILYDDSWQEWGNREGTPVETSGQAAPAAAADKDGENR